MWALHRLTSFCREKCLRGREGCAGDRKPVGCQPPNGLHSPAVSGSGGQSFHDAVADLTLSSVAELLIFWSCWLSPFPLWLLESDHTYSFVPEPEDEAYLPIRDHNLLKDIACVLRWKCSWASEMVQVPRRVTSDDQHLVEGENQLCEVVLCPPCSCTDTYTPTYII